MSLSVSPGAEALLDQKIHRWAKLFRIRRLDGEVFKFTSAAKEITFRKEKYSPVNGIDTTAVRQQSGMQPKNAEARGVFDVDDVTLEDFRLGLFDEARVDEFTVDWMFPEEEPMLSAEFWIINGEWDGETWIAQIEGLTRWLRPEVGRVYTRNCRHDLGRGFPSGPGCTVDLAGLTIVNVGVDSGDVIDDRLQFGASLSDISAGLGDDYFQHGRVLWNTGQNAGTVSEVRKYTSANREFLLQLPTLYPIADTDSFDAEPGCDWVRATCIGRYNNIDEFGGHPSMPGTDAIIQRARPAR